MTDKNSGVVDAMEKALGVIKNRHQILDELGLFR